MLLVFFARFIKNWKHCLIIVKADTVHGWMRAGSFPSNSLDENRFVTVGTSLTGEILVVIHTDRDNRIRMISARKATSTERKAYESG